MEGFAFPTEPAARNVVYEKNGLRLSLLTPCLLRLEKGAFTDLPTRTVWNRDLGAVSCTCEEQPGLCILRTGEAVFRVDTRKGRLESVTFSDGTVVKDFRKGMLPGTARTLDTANGKVKLEKGILSRSGVSLMDDSGSVLLEPGGNVLPREKCRDIYCFAYGRDYLRQLRDFYRLTGPVPLIPKFALGNWWSRYKAYTQAEYRALMEEFIRRKLPVTVATIDMDWHWTDVVARFGEKARPAKPKCREEVLYNTLLQGWTGYSWNRELFPDHRALLSWLHEKNFRVTLNVHPSQGIRFFEDCYEAVCRRLGKDPDTGEAVPFDFADPKFIEAYFEEIHHPLEAEGVDFWWLDWQQGTATSIPGLDPLWALNHYHTLDNGRTGKRPLILSRYAGLGSHRYPLGFSGDTICSWKSLNFQPYFTNCAANAGYSWWSHDIGGHMLGIQDDELYLRWLQYGVFSPINRLHSSASDFMGKEPWKRSWAVEKISEEFLRLRHRLIPYLYSANYRTHTQAEPICMPLYYRYDREEAYSVRNAYLFGGQLLVCPVTMKLDRRLNLAATALWLPEGRWTDIFNGRVYRGGRYVTVYRDLDSIPVFAPEGAIVPMYQSGDSNGLSPEQPLEINVWRGNGKYELYEDDGETFSYQQGKFAVTTFETQCGPDTLTFTVCPPENPGGILPEQRVFAVRFRDIKSGEVYVNGQKVDADPSLVSVAVASQGVTLEVRNFRAAGNVPREELRTALLTRVQGSNHWKNRHFYREKLPKFVENALQELEAMVWEQEDGHGN